MRKLNSISKRSKDKPKKRVDKKQCLCDAWRAHSKTCLDPWPFEPEYRFHPQRRWPFDWAMPALRLAIELEGVTNSMQKLGRHQRPEGYEADCEKYNAAVELGWIVLRYTQRQVERDPERVIDQVLRIATQRRKAMYGNRPQVKPTPKQGAQA